MFMKSVLPLFLKVSTLLSTISVIKVVNGQIELSVGEGHSCAFERTSAELKCWGYNYYYQLNMSDRDIDQMFPINVFENADLEVGKAGALSTCMIEEGTNSVSCVGYNDYGQLGIGSTSSPVTTPTVVISQPSTKIVYIVISKFHSCALNEQKALFCTGKNDKGQLGMGDETNRDSFESVNSGHSVVMLDVGMEHTCFVDVDSALLCMGLNHSGQLAIGGNDYSYKNIPTAVNLEGSTVKKLSCGSFHTCIINDQDRALCAGVNNDGQLGVGDNEKKKNVLTLVVQQDNDAVAIAAGGFHTCFMVINGKVFCMGWNFYGQLGNGGRTDSNIPVEVDMSTSVTPVELGSGNTHSCISTTTYQVYCWGRGKYGRLGNGSTSNQSKPTLVQAINWPVPPTKAPPKAPTKAGSNVWFIDNIGKATEQITSSDTVLISLEFNATNKDIGALVFQEDCVTPFDNSNYFLADTTSKTSSKPDDYVQFNSTLLVNVTAINGTEYWNEFTDGTRGGWVQACVETYLSFSDDLDLGNDDAVQKVDFKNNILNISVSLTASYEVDEVNVAREEAGREDVDTDYSKFVVAYECDAADPYAEATPVNPYNQGDEITICVSDESNGIVQVEEFVNLVVAQDGNTPYNFILGTLYNPDITTPVCLEAITTERRVCYAKIRALARFFQSAAPGDLTISGSVYVIRDGRRVRRNLRMALPAAEKSSEEDEHALAVGTGRRAEEEEEGSGEFEVKVSLGSADDSAASGRIFGSGAAGLMSMAVGAAGAALIV